jgi:hypothetical protein
MTFLKVKWRHIFESEPIEIYNKLDSERWERWKFEVFANGAMKCADKDRQSGATRLAIEPIPSNDEIAKDPQFEVTDITAVEFEEVWQRALSERSR